MCTKELWERLSADCDSFKGNEEPWEWLRADLNSDK
jgi:hypothetical protein